MMGIIKKTIASLHLWLGISLGAIFIVTCLTGAILVFEEQLDPILYPHLYKHTDAGPVHAVLPVDVLIDKASRATAAPLRELRLADGYPERFNLLLRTEGDRLQRSFIGINPYTGNIEYQLKGSRHLFSFAEELHRKLLVGKKGKLLVGFCCTGYLIISVSGLVLWWPKNKKILKQRLKIKWDAKFKRLNWDLHAVGGLYVLPLLLIMIVTGLTWSFDWINAGVFLLADGKPEQKEVLYTGFQDGAKRKDLYTYIVQQADRFHSKGTVMHLQLPRKGDDIIKIETAEQFLYFHGYTGELQRHVSKANQSKGTKIKEFMKPLHTGNFGGVLTQSIYFLAVLFATTLSVTGTLIWLGRKRKKKPTPGRHHRRYHRTVQSRQEEY